MYVQKKNHSTHIRIQGLVLSMVLGIHWRSWNGSPGDKGELLYIYLANYGQFNEGQPVFSQEEGKSLEQSQLSKNRVSCLIKH